MGQLKEQNTDSMALEDSLQKREERTSSVSRQYPKLVEFEAKYRNPEKSQPMKDRIVNLVKTKAKNCDVKATLKGYFPIIRTLATYKVKEYLPDDVIAGITSGVMMIPQGMAFAALATLPHVVGLYISLFASLTYLILGTGRQLSWGCIAVLSLMTENILQKYDNSEAGLDFIANLNRSLNDGSENGTHNIDFEDAITDRRIQVASSVTVIAGLILIVASRLGLSRITVIMSNSLITGFTIGIAMIVATSQLSGVFGLDIPRKKGIGRVMETWIAIIEKLPETNIPTLIISLISIVIMYLVKRFINEKFKKKMLIPIPIELIAVIMSTCISHYAQFYRRYDVKIVKTVSTGVPKPNLPDIPLVTDYIGDAFVIIIVAFAQSLAVAKTMGLKHNYSIDSSQEMLACGACNMVSGLFSGYITGASVSRSIVQDGAGGKTQVASLFAAGIVLFVIMLIGPYFYCLPTCVLSAIILVNLRTMFLKLLTIPEEWRKSKFDCAIWVFSFLATIILNPDIGLLASVMFSLLIVIFRSMLQPVEEIGKIEIETNPNLIQLRSLENYASVQISNSVKLIKVKTPLYFVNSDSFTSAVFEKVKVDPLKVKELNEEKANESCNVGETSRLFSLKVLVIDISEVGFIDVMGVQALELIITEYKSIGIEVFITSVPENLFGILHSTGFWKKQGDRLFISVEAALASATATNENPYTTEKSNI